MRDRPPIEVSESALITVPLHQLSNMQALAEHHLAVFCTTENVGTFSHGDPVMSRIDLSPDTGDDVTVVWHPDPTTHPANQPRVLSEDSRLAKGEHRKLVISAPGVLQAIPIGSSG